MCHELIDCPNHGGGYDCTPFCRVCEGDQSYCPVCNPIHLNSAPIEVLELTLCKTCNTNNMAEYSCRDELKSNVALCVDCCHCPEHDECDPCEYWVEEN